MISFWKYKKLQKGSILPIAVIISFMSLGIVFAFYSWVSTKKFQLRYRIAKTRALYNAETGMAEKAYPYLHNKGFIAGYKAEGEDIEKMGWYESPEFWYDNLDRVAQVTGVTEIKNSFGEEIEVKATVQMPARVVTLGIYMYLTDSELAGGAPYVFDSPAQRREVNFGSGDQLTGVIQSNGSLVVSDYGCPDFSGATVYFTKNSPAMDLGSCGSYSSLFGGSSNIDTTTVDPVILPPAGYDILKKHYTDKFEADLKIDSNAIKDTLIMTDLHFFESGEFRIRQWWYLMPPHLKPNPSNIMLPIASDLNGADLNGDGEISASECSDPSNLVSCDAYQDSLYYFHAKYINPQSLSENYINSTIRASHGFSHFDFTPLDYAGNPSPTSLLRDETISGGNYKVIYIKGGPVSVHGTYKGRYTVVTDDFTTYRRHAWPYMYGGPVDTIWNNIWIIDDLVNIDAGDEGNLSESQPDDDCEGGTDNILGLVSGANIIIANTKANGARNSFYGSDISINAGIIALNESFVMHYWQNTTSGYNDPAHGDGRGPSIFGGTTGNADDRGEVHFWGSIVQKYRGYMLRNATGPYNITPGIGMDKDYYYDANMRCTPPPFYPAVEYDNGLDEVNVEVIDYKRIRD